MYGIGKYKNSIIITIIIIKINNYEYNFPNNKETHISILCLNYF